MLEASAWVSVDMSGHCDLTVHLVPVKTSRSEDLLSAHDDDALAVEQVFGDVACKTAQQVAASINDNLSFEPA